MRTALRHRRTASDTLQLEWECDRDAQKSKCHRREHRRLSWGDWLLAADQEPPLGAHVVSPRHGYDHHGIYVGNGMVVHYGGLAHGLCRGPVEEVSLARFADGRAVWVRSGASQRFDCEEVIRRARSRVGENRYRLLTNNCEHFCEWCLRGEARSQQVDAWLSQPRRVVHATLNLLARVIVVATGHRPACGVAQSAPGEA